MEHPDDVSCTLDPYAALGQLLEWADLQALALEVSELPTGARMVLPGQLEGSVADLISRESECCTFLELGTSIVGGQLVLEITSERREAQSVISVLSGLGQS